MAAHVEIVASITNLLSAWPAETPKCNQRSLPGGRYFKAGSAVWCQTSDFVIHRVDNMRQRIRAGVAKPVSDLARLSKLLCDRIEKIDPGVGIERLALVTLIVEPLETDRLRRH